jgi:hypothetical protein
LHRRVGGGCACACLCLAQLRFAAGFHQGLCGAQVVVGPRDFRLGDFLALLHGLGSRIGNRQLAGERQSRLTFARSRRIGFALLGPETGGTLAACLEDLGDGLGVLALTDAARCGCAKVLGRCTWGGIEPGAGLARIRACRAHVDTLFEQLRRACLRLLKKCCKRWRLGPLADRRGRSEDQRQERAMESDVNKYFHKRRRRTGAVRFFDERLFQSGCSLRRERAHDTQ